MSTSPSGEPQAGVGRFGAEAMPLRPAAERGAEREREERLQLVTGKSGKRGRSLLSRGYVVPLIVLLAAPAAALALTRLDGSGSPSPRSARRTASAPPLRGTRRSIPRAPALGTALAIGHKARESRGATGGSSPRHSRAKPRRPARPAAERTPSTARARAPASEAVAEPEVTPPPPPSEATPPATEPAPTVSSPQTSQIENQEERELQREFGFER